MPRAFFVMIALLGISASAFGQDMSSDAQTLQALLNEVRALRQELRVSLNRAQSMQILRVRFQMQEGAITRASDRLNSARENLSGARLHQENLAREARRLEDGLNSAGNVEQQTALQDAIKQVKSNVEAAVHMVQQRQAEEIQATAVTGRTG